VLGDLSVGSWVAVLVPGAVLLPRRRLGPVRRTPPEWELSQGDDVGADGLGAAAGTRVVRPLPGVPVLGGAPPTDLPWTLRPAARRRRIGWALITASLLTGFTLLPVARWSADLPGRAVVALALLTYLPLLAGWRRVSGQLTLEHRGARIEGTFLSHQIPWEKLREVRLTEDDRVILGWGENLVLESGPYPWAEAGAITIAGLRDRARAMELTGREVIVRLRRPTVALLVCYPLMLGLGQLLILT
jgi:hypothetical protein